jgi:hypothetical protein
MKPTAPDRRARGFTLLEALIAGAVFFVALTGVTLLSVNSQSNAARSMAFAQGSRVATQEMEKYAMLGYNGIGAMFDGGTLPTVPLYFVNEAPDGGGRAYAVQILLFNSRGPSTGAQSNGIPVPGLGASGLDVPSYFIQASVTWNQPNGQLQQNVTQGTYVSPVQ